MPSGTLSSIQADIKAGTPSPLYLIVGDDDRGKDDIVHEFDALVPEEIRPFNLERVSALDTDPASVVATARTLSLLGDRRVMIVARAEKWLTAKRKGKGDDDAADEGAGDGASEDTGALGDYIESPEPSTTLVLVAADINRTTRLAKQLVKQAVVVECWGLKSEKEARGYAIGEALEKEIGRAHV